MSVIPADDFGLDGDRAWWIINDPRHASGHGHQRIYSDLDRPCGTCEHYRALPIDDQPTKVRHDCIDGRHTWNIQVECSEPDIARYEDQGWHNGPSCAALNCEDGVIGLRVSVVPGMVLPIVRTFQHRLDLFIHNPSLRAVIVLRPKGDCYLWDRQDTHKRITLPPGARPGSSAVLLNVQPVSE